MVVTLVNYWHHRYSLDFRQLQDKLNDAYK
jgi:hypothetical protein